MLPKIPRISTEHESLKDIAEWMSAIARRLNTLLPTGGAGIAATSIPGVGTVLQQQLQAMPLGFRLGVIVDQGPVPDAGGDPLADYTDNRYWVKDAYLFSNPDDDDTSVAEPQPEDADEALAFTATNLSEHADGTHSLATDGTVFVWYTRIRSRSASGETVDQAVFAFGGTAAGFSAKVTGGTLIAGEDAKWNYALAEVDLKETLSDGSSVAKTDGRTTASGGRNLLEMNNPSDGLGLMGSGDTVESLSFPLGRVPDNTVVWVHRIAKDCDGIERWYFSSPNQKPGC